MRLSRSPETYFQMMSIAEMRISSHKLLPRRLHTIFHEKRITSMSLPTMGRHMVVMFYRKKTRKCKLDMRRECPLWSPCQTMNKLPLRIARLLWMMLGTRMTFLLRSARRTKPLKNLRNHAPLEGSQRSKSWIPCLLNPTRRRMMVHPRTRKVRWNELQAVELQYQQALSCQKFLGTQKHLYMNNLKIWPI
jgi:hypothetical protein